MELTTRYLKGFNHAYVLAKHKPELLKQLLEIATENEYLQGMHDGKNTYEQERLKNKTHARLQELNQQSAKKDRERDLER